jgi:predicted nuclease with TOPRIM domain
MLSPDDTTKTTDAVEQSPRTFDHRSALSERRQNILQQKQVEKETDTLPAVRAETSEHGTPHAKVAWRQVVQLREENRHLRHQLDEARDEMQRLLTAYTTIQAEFEREVAAIHRGQVQELEQYQSHLQEVTNERNRLQESYKQMEHRYQELYANFQISVDEEAEKKLSDMAQTLVLSPEKVTTILPNDAMKTIEFHVNQVKTKQLVEAQYLTGEVQRITAHLEQEQSQVEEERQTLLRMQNSVREQAELRHKTLQAHLRARWTFALAFVILGALVALVVLQYLFLFLFHVHFVAAITFSLIAPIVLCVIAAIVLSGPLSAMRHHYTSAPHKKKVKK